MIVDKPEHKDSGLKRDLEEHTMVARKKKVQDLEIKDAQLIFNSVWQELESTYDIENLRFPKEIFWLNGGPGAGKGTHTRFIMEYRDLTANPILVSTLLKSPEAQKRIDSGLLVGDQEVTKLVFKALLDPLNQSGVVVDGYPRTHVQVQCLKLFYNQLNSLRIQFLNSSLEYAFEQPKFHIVVLFVEESESVRRQLLRGKTISEQNREVEVTGMGKVVPIRNTDLSEEHARNRYRTFKEITYNALLSLRKVFHYHYINAHGSIEQVQRRIVKELRYQSSLELKRETFDRLSKIPLASQIGVHARQELVSRLDDYEKNHTELFERVVNLLSKKFFSIIYRHNIAGMARINSEDPVFDIPLALAMALDVFSERGYKCTVDVRKTIAPVKVNPKTFEIENRTHRYYRFIINFASSGIRRGR